MTETQAAHDTDTSLPAYLDPCRRQDICLLFDVREGNPNGDPDADGQPRMDEPTGHGVTTDTSLKRKIRDTIPQLTADLPDEQRRRYGIFVQANVALNSLLEQACEEAGVVLEQRTRDTRPKPIAVQDAEQVRAALQDRWFDIRMFGAVLSTGRTTTLGSLRGPLQVSFARSVDPIEPQQHTITRLTATRQEDIDGGKTRDMGRKWTVPYGLYVASLSYAAGPGQRAGVTTEDLRLLYQALILMWDATASAARSTMATRGLYVFSHPNSMGTHPSHTLHELISIQRATDTTQPARSFTDYQVTVANAPADVTLTRVELANLAVTHLDAERDSATH